ncbi:TPA: hypothetical protein SMV41_003558 [Proteus mirabilis]|jgi:hypothetical protein|uniref:Uncharacterized protein n=3 Tax=Morganellaceae TaxID=1903414 RepID=A0A220DHP1_PRORE|nr:MULTISPECIES: hypothetical protein [Enterobacterales]MBA7799705.1 hypothetical protein [Citrobacter sp. RHBSTW-01065]MCU9038145.1 hypothetical protein [Pseudomonas aeruginosa]HAN2841579.1 hypothetical protein [Escherichia coli O25b:H4-ST131]ARV75784.1 hypothetical protein PRE36P2_0500 [Providencia rettgeri]ASB04160.1 hypothetical protein AM403_21095 [Proteus mirabilis]
MKLFHVILNVTNDDFEKNIELKNFYEVAQSLNEVKEKFKIFKNARVSAIVVYDLFLEPVTVKFTMSAYNVHNQVIFCESQPTIVNNTLDLITKLNNYFKQDYLTVDWKYI